MEQSVRQYAVVTGTYWAFTLTDGALRMLVLLNFHVLGFSPFLLALLFVLYEATGVPANLLGGWLATRFGISRMLAVGIGLQVGGLLLLSGLDEAWAPWFAVSWVMAAQGLCGVAKDLTKTASKSAIKLTAAAGPAGSGRLFRWVAWFTGSKNAMKGFGFFLGGVLLAVLGFRGALWLMAAVLGLVLAGVLVTLPRDLGVRPASRSVREFFARESGINVLAAARLALFAARDVWFVVAVPVFLYASGWSFAAVGTFMALWTIGYGIVQVAAPGIVAAAGAGFVAERRAARRWAGRLACVPALLAIVAVVEPAALEWIVIGGLCLFGVVFAINSALHSFLVLAYARSEKAAEDVGFYYAANAAGRLLGTLLSGLLYQWTGLPGVLAGSAVLIVAAWGATTRLPGPAAGLDQPAP